MPHRYIESNYTAQSKEGQAHTSEQQGLPHFASDGSGGLGINCWSKTMARLRFSPCLIWFKVWAARLVAAEFIEDFHEKTMEPTIEMLYGAARPSPDKDESLVMLRIKKKVWLELSAFDFAKSSQLLESWKSPEQSVRIFAHGVPNCAGEELLELFTSRSEGFGWERAVQLHALHSQAVHEAIMSSSARVYDPDEATVFYIPAFFSLLVERYIDSDMASVEILNCIANTWGSLPQQYFYRNAGYDHFIVAGTCHPYSVCAVLECDVTMYHPYARNVFSLVGGVREIGHPDFAFAAGKGFQQLRTVFVPFPVTLNCERALRLAEQDRNTVVSFIGTENSRVRSIFKSLVEDPSRTYASDPRLYIKVLQDTEGDDGEEARKATLGEGGMRPIDDLYADSEFCLVLPGHIYDLGRRAYDAMARACVLVIVAMAPMFVSVPFAWQVPWEKFAIFTTVRDTEDAAKILDSLLLSTQHEEQLCTASSPGLLLPPSVMCRESSDIEHSCVHSTFQQKRAAPAGWQSCNSLSAGHPAALPATLVPSTSRALSARRGADRASS